MANCYNCKHLNECKHTKEEKKDCKRFIYATCDICGCILTPSELEDYRSVCEYCHDKYND